MLIFDIESKTFGKPDPLKDEFRFLGAYSYTTKKHYFLNMHQKEDIKELFKQHKIVIGHNIQGYDIPILERAGLWNKNNLVLDTYKIIKKRRDILGLKNASLSLSNIAKHFKLKTFKDEKFDYEILNQTGWNNEELAKIEKYTMQDVKVTKNVFEHIYKYFEPFKEFLNKHDINSFKWLTSTLAVLGYKVICNLCGIKEIYDDSPEHKPFKGGYVQEPTTKYANNVYYMDFASLYPHIMIQANLFSWHCKCCKEEEKWTGNKIFPIEGKYCKKNLGKIEKTILELYKKRQEYKKIGDKREYTIKIIINSIYGISGNPIFKSLYNHYSASDTTKIGRQMIKLAINTYKEEGYEVIYGDTDSCFVKDIYKDKERLLKHKEKIITKIKNNLPFPQKTFDMKIDEEIEHIWFFKTGSKYNKKQYVYVTKNNKVKVTGMAMIKSDGSIIGYKIFNKYMKENIKHGVNKFKYEKVKSWVDKEITNNIDLCTRSFKVFKKSVYKNDNQLQAQISNKFGPGNHRLIPNKKFGVGKGKTKFCTKKEYKDNGLEQKDIVLDKMWKELKSFVLDYPEFKKTVFRKKRNISFEQKQLFQWTNIEED